MFLMQVQHQQILSHLCQITPRWHTIRLKQSKAQSKPRHTPTQAAHYDALCHSSLAETLHNFRASPNETMLELSASAIGNRDFAMRSKFDETNRAITQLDKLQRTLKVNSLASMASSTSSATAGDASTASTEFALAQKRAQAMSSAIATSSLFQHAFRTALHNSIQTRGFKTHRNIDAKQRRDPSLTSRLQELMSVNLLTKMDSARTSKQRRGKLEEILKTADRNSSADQKQNIKIAFAEGYLAASPDADSRWLQKLFKATVLLVGLVLVVFYVTFMGTKKVFKFSLGGPNEIDPEDITVSFKDVRGCDEAKQELHEIVEFLKNPQKFSHLGGKLPKGVLLVGPPGTGKTLLARAVAGEAGVPFFHAAGAEFDEILVGQGARRVRDLFKAAKERAPCVIFIDEIDSVGGKRTNSVLHPYANQTINQLLSEMDGFHQNEGVIVLGATNRRNDLDKALLRPGRFDVEVTVPLPDFIGRQQIIELYLQRILHENIDVKALASGTTGFTGADLENMINQAALRAAIDGADVVTTQHMEYARDKLLMGPERKARLPDEETNQIIAYHEAGHAIVCHYTKDSNPLHKVTIMPRGASLGHTAYLPEKEQYLHTRSQLLAMMDMAMGGRAAEELIFGPDKVTTGSGSDLQRASDIAQRMVKDLGMSKTFGLRTVSKNSDCSDCGDNGSGHNSNAMIDAEIKQLTTESYERARAILKARAKEHKALAEALLKYETLDANDIKTILSGGKIE